jgi:hypothetical protein
VAAHEARLRGLIAPMWRRVGVRTPNYREALDRLEYDETDLPSIISTWQ